MTKPTIPPEALANHVAILAKTGAGKSNAAKTIVEDLLDAGERVCAVDPTGTWWGLRLKPNGKPSPYRILIFGGQHADVQIGGRDGAAIAEVVGTSATSCIIDTRLMKVSERTQFFTDFAEALLRANKGVLNLVIDEAHVFAPKGKVADPASGKMLHAASNLVSLGRGIGLRVMLLSQRPAKLHNDVLSCVETLVAMRMILPHDVAAVMDWVREQADVAKGRAITASLPSLPTGDAWVWSPQLDLLDRRRFRLVRTKDTGKPLSSEEAAVELVPLQIDDITARLKEVAAEVVANDPKTLKAEIARLKSDAAKAPAIDQETLARVEQSAERAGYDRGAAAGEARGYELGLVEGRRIGLKDAYLKLNGSIPKLLADLWTEAEAVEAPPMSISSTSSEAVKMDTLPRPTPPRPVPARSPQRPAVDQSPGAVPPGCAKPLASLAAVYPSGLTEAQWSTAAGYKRSGGTWGTYKSRLRGAGLIEQRDGRWFATEAGASAAGEVELPPPPGPELVRWWCAKLPGVTKLAEALLAAWPEELDRDELAERVGMAASGGSFGTYLSRLAGPGLIERTGRTIRLTSEAMGG
jgi:hypothetical protein